MNLLRALFDPDVQMSGVAMVRDIPRALQLKQVDGSLFFSGTIDVYASGTAARACTSGS